MGKALFTLLLLICTSLPALAAPNNTSGPWGMDAGGFKNLSTALASPLTVGKTVVVSKPMAINNKTVKGNRLVKVITGGSINPAAGKTVAFALDSSLELGTSTAVGGSGTVTGLRRATPENFGAISGDGLDDAPAIMAMFNAVRGQTSKVTFDGNYDIAYGFIPPSNCTIDLKRSTMKYLPTFGQGTIPTYGFGYAAFFIGQAAEGISGTIGNITITGDGWVIDGNRANLTGSPNGSTGIKITTSTIPVQADLYKLKNIRISNGMIQNCYFYGSMVYGAEDVIFSKVRYWNNDLIAACVISGKGIKYNYCDFSGTTSVNNAVQGMGVWNEPNETWQDIIQVEYNNCSARYNYGGGFLLWSNGADAVVDVTANNCWSYNNSYNGSAQFFSASNGGFAVSPGVNTTSSFKVVMTDCVADKEYSSGFRISRGSTASGGQQIILNNPLARNTNIYNSTSPFSSPITVIASEGTTGLAAMEVQVNNPVVISPAANTLGYGINVSYSQNVRIFNPMYQGTFAVKRSDRTMSGTAAYAGGEIAASNYALVSTTVTGAVLGDFIQVSYDKSLSGCIASGYVQTNGTVYLKIDNNTAGAQTIAAGNFRYTVIPQ